MSVDFRLNINGLAALAEQALRDKTTEFNEMRGVLMRAPEEVDKVLARTVDIRARLEPARATLEQLRGEICVVVGGAPPRGPAHGI